VSWPGEVLVCGGNRGAWRWSDRAHEEIFTNGIEAWVFALRGEYRPGSEFRSSDLDRYDLIILNLNLETLDHYERELKGGSSRRAKVAGLYEGDLAALNASWRSWSRVADLCDLVIAINAHGLSFLQSLTSSPVRFIGIPYPVDGIRSYHVPYEERERAILLCAPPLARPLDYLAARPTGLPMYAYEESFSRRPRDLVKHRSFDKERYIRRAAGLYDDASLTILAKTNFAEFFRRASRSLLWMNLDPRYTWARYVLDAAALGIPIITTRETWHASHLFPDLVVDTPYDIAGATALAQRLLNDEEFYRSTTEQALAGLVWYKEATERLRDEIRGMNYESER
jgi:hypothetical protein